MTVAVVVVLSLNFNITLTFWCLNLFLMDWSKEIQPNGLQDTFFALMSINPSLLQRPPDKTLSYFSPYWYMSKTSIGIQVDA